MILISMASDVLPNSPELFLWLRAFLIIGGSVIVYLAREHSNNQKSVIETKTLEVKEKEELLSKYRDTISKFSDRVDLLRINEELVKELNNYKTKEKSFYELYVKKFEEIAVFISTLQAITVNKK